MLNAIFYMGFSQTATPLLSSAALGMGSMNVIKDFFTHLFLYPEKHVMAIMVMSVVVIAAAVGLAFLIKKVYDKFCPDRNVT